MNITFNKNFEKKVYVKFENTSTGNAKLDSFLEKREISYDKPSIKYYIDQDKEILLLLLSNQDDKKNLIIGSKNLFNRAKEENFDSFSVIIPKENEREIFKSMLEGFLHANYSFDKYKKESKKKEINISFETSDYSKEKEEIENIIEGINLTRDLVNTPSNDLYPETLASEAKENLEKLGIKVEVYSKEEIKELKMEAFLAVAEGSDKEPKLIVMKYLPRKDEKPIVLVGKGLTYDSGGYALKPAKGMVTMKADMAGSASVIGALYAAAKNKIEKNVIGVVAACENMVSGKAYKNGDIIGSMKGDTIEVLNTDAEGRLTLADALYYSAVKLDPKEIIDLATLTGACVVGLGNYTTGAVTNNKDLMARVKDAFDESLEYVCELPSNDELREEIKGDLGDIKNSTYSPGGAITAGLFLENFVMNYPWVHLDIAGPAHVSKAFSFYPEGSTGIPVKSLYNFIKNAK